VPTYAFRCGKCRVEFDVRLSFSDSHKAVKCPSCASKHVDRLYGSAFQASMEVNRLAGKGDKDECESCGGASCGTCAH